LTISAIEELRATYRDVFRNRFETVVDVYCYGDPFPAAGSQIALSATFSEMRIRRISKLD
jgi:hypothetical protein